MKSVSKERQALLALARAEGDRRFDPSTGLCLITRDTCWYGSALLFDPSADRQAFGNRILGSLRSQDGTHTPASMLALLGLSPETLETRVADFLREQVAAELVHAAETEWRDGNVNHPLGAYCTLVCGGAMSNAGWAVELGTRRLRRMLDRVGEHRSRTLRQAEISEYVSLTYTPLSICFLALISEYAPPGEARDLALRLEEGMWVDMAMHFHPPTQQFAGPHSRSYHEDSVGGYSAMHALILAAGLGPLYLQPELPVRFDHPSDLLQNALTAIVPFHVPDLSREIFWNKPFPYAFRKTTYAESYHENSRRDPSNGPEGTDPPFAFDEEVYPGGWTDLTTYMTRDYALGSAAVPYVNGGHTDSMMLRVRCGPRVEAMADFRSIWSRGVYNGAEPGRPNYCHTARTSVDASYLYEEGRPLTYQHENHLLVSYSPKRAGHREVTSFRVDVQCTAGRPFDQILAGGRPLASLPARYPGDTRILLRDPYTYILVQPLPLLPAGGPTPLAIRIVDDFFLISLYNYDGDLRTFSRDEIGAWRSGFYLAVYSAEEFQSWEDFCAFGGEITVNEEVDGPGIRTVTVETGRGVMEFVNDPRREQILGRRWNGSEERTTYFEVSAAGHTGGIWCPTTLFGREGFR